MAAFSSGALGVNARRKALHTFSISTDQELVKVPSWFSFSIERGIDPLIDRMGAAARGR